MIADACCSPLIPAAHHLAHPACAISEQSGHLLGGFALLEQPEHLPVRAFHRIAGLAVPLVKCFCCQFRFHFDSFCHTSIIHYLNGFDITQPPSTSCWLLSRPDVLISSARRSA